MLNFNKEYFKLEENRQQYATNFPDLMTNCEVYGKKQNPITTTAYVYLIPKDYYTYNAGNIDFTNYPDGIWNDYTDIKIVKAEPYFDLDFSFSSTGDITPENLNNMFKKIKNSFLETQKDIVEKQIFMDSGIPEQLGLPKLPIGCIWYQDTDGLVALPVSKYYSMFQELIEALRKIIRELLEEDFEELKQKAFESLEKKTEELIQELQNSADRLLLIAEHKQWKANTIEDLKSMQFLQVGDVVEVLGYYQAGDGAGHKRVIADSDDGSGVQLENGLWANIYGEEYKLSNLGLLTEEKIKNFSILKKLFDIANNKKITIIIDGKYKLKADNKIIIHNINLTFKGILGCLLELSEDSTSQLFSFVGKCNFISDGVNYYSNANNYVFFIYCADSLGEWSFENLHILNSTFKGDGSMYLETKKIDPSTLEGKINNFIFENNYIENFNHILISIYDTPINNSLIINNIVKNFKYDIVRIVINNDHPFESKMHQYIKDVIINNNQVLEEDDYTPSKLNNGYHTFCLIECKNATVTNNKVEGLKATNKDCVVYDFYINCEKLFHQGNVSINNFNLNSYKCTSLLMSKEGVYKDGTDNDRVQDINKGNRVYLDNFYKYEYNKLLELRNKYSIDYNNETFISFITLQNDISNVCIKGNEFIIFALDCPSCRIKELEISNNTFIIENTNNINSSNIMSVSDIESEEVVYNNVIFSNNSIIDKSEAGLSIIKSSSKEYDIKINNNDLTFVSDETLVSGVFKNLFVTNNNIKNIGNSNQTFRYVYGENLLDKKSNIVINNNLISKNISTLQYEQIRLPINNFVSIKDKLILNQLIRANNSGIKLDFNIAQGVYRNITMLYNITDKKNAKSIELKFNGILYNDGTDTILEYYDNGIKKLTINSEMSTTILNKNSDFNLIIVFNLGYPAITLETNQADVVGFVIEENIEIYDNSIKINLEPEVVSLNTPYYTYKMEQEGGTTKQDFYSYLDEKYAYDKQLEAEEKAKYKAYELLLQENPNLTWEEFETQYSNSSMMNLSLVEKLEEPTIPESVQNFINKYINGNTNVITQPQPTALQEINTKLNKALTLNNYLACEDMKEQGVFTDYKTYITELESYKSKLEKGIFTLSEIPVPSEKLQRYFEELKELGRF